MTSATLQRETIDPLYWVVAAASAVLGPVLLTLGGPVAFRYGITAAALLAATCMAIGDLRTGKLRNAWTGPFITAAVLQLLTAAVSLPHPLAFAATAILSVLVNAGLYLAMAVAGWVGFGDVKFVAGLSLIGTAITGSLAMLFLTPTALVIAATGHAVSVGGSRRSSSRPHGPALVAALAAILLMASLSHA